MLLTENSRRISDSSTTSTTIRKKKSVRFADGERGTATTTYMDTEAVGLVLTEEHRDEQWFSKEDLRKIGLEKEAEIKNCKKLCLGLLLDSTFEDPCVESRTYLDSLTRFGGWRMDGDDEVEKKKKFVCFSPRGLERSLSSLHADERGSMKKRCIQGVLARQKLMKKRRQTMEPFEIWSELSTVSNGYSRLAKKFAIRQGKADEHAAQEGNDDDSTIALHLIKKMKLTSSRRPPMERTRSAPLVYSLGSTRILGGGKSSRKIMSAPPDDANNGPDDSSAVPVRIRRRCPPKRIRTVDQRRRIPRRSSQA